MDELEGKSIGERIQTLRERTGKSRAVVAGLGWWDAPTRGSRRSSEGGCCPPG